MKILFSVAALIIFLLAHSQIKISGFVVDQQKHPVSGVPMLVHSEKGNEFQILTDNKGRFAISLAKNALYWLKLSHVGYTTVSLKINTEKTDLDQGTVILPLNADLLSEVTIKSRKQAVKQKGDTLEFSSSSYKVNQDASAEELIRKMPGVSLEDSVIKAQGEEVKKVTIDGREFFGDDATAALKKIPAEIIDKIQVFDRMSENAALTGFDDGNSAKSINIITKAEMRNGRFGRVSAGYGSGDTYNAGGNMSY